MTLQVLSILIDFIVHFSFKRIVHPSDFENNPFLPNTCLLSKRFKTGKVQTKVQTKERNMGWKWSRSKRLYLELPGCIVRLKEG